MLGACAFGLLHVYISSSYPSQILFASDAAALVRTILNAVQYIHDRGVVHCGQSPLFGLR